MNLNSEPLVLRPWRLLFSAVDSVPVALDELFFSAILALESKYASDDVDWENIVSWNIDQDLGTLTLIYDGEEVALNARIQIIGSFDGSSFMWACHNPSVREELKLDSKRVREMGRNQGWQFFELDEFPATSRDGFAIMAFTQQTLHSHSAYAGQSGDRVVYFTLYDLVAADPIGAEPLQEEQPPPSPFDTLYSMLDAQVAAVQFGLPELRKVEAQCMSAHAEVQAGNYLNAVSILDSAWESLGEYAVDQEPASWIRLAKGNALYLAGNIAAAYEALLQAEDSFACPNKVLLYIRLGQCAADMNDIERAQDLFVRVYVAAGTSGLTVLSQQHQALAHSALSKIRNEAKQRIAATSVPSQPDPQLGQATAIVQCLIEDLYHFEESANELSELAENEREIDHELCDADRVAEDQINSQWCTILARWCTTGHSPRSTSRSYPPEHDPDQETITSITRNDEGTIVVDSVSHDSYERNWRYLLCEQDGELRVSQISAVFDDEEYPSI